MGLVKLDGRELIWTLEKITDDQYKRSKNICLWLQNPLQNFDLQWKMQLCSPSHHNREPEMQKAILFYGERHYTKQQHTI